MNTKALAKRIRLSLPMIRAVESVYETVGKVKCQGKCQDCCSPVADLMSAFERDRIIARTGKIPNSFPIGVVWDGQRYITVLDKTPANLGTCNLLGADGRCTVYDIRPAICRIWGASDKMKCPHGCEGSGETPDDLCRAVVMHIRIATHDYDSPIPVVRVIDVNAVPKFPVDAPARAPEVIPNDSRRNC